MATYSLLPPIKSTFTDQNGNPLSGGKVYFYQSGTSTPISVYQNSVGTLATNPIILDARGQANIWLGDDQVYRVRVFDQYDVFQYEQDPVVGTNSGGGGGNGEVSTLRQEVITATEGQTVFDLTITYPIGSKLLSVFVNGAKQLVGVDYVETTTSRVTFLSGLNVGDVVAFEVLTTNVGVSTTADLVGYQLQAVGSVVRTAESKFGEYVSVKDFGAVGNGSTDDTTAFNTALSACNVLGTALYIPAGTYIVGRLTLVSNQKIFGESKATTILKLKDGANTDILYGLNSDALYGTNANAGVNNVTIRDLTLDGNRANNTAGSCISIYGSALNFYDLNIRNAAHHGIRTEWFQFGEQQFGMEGHFERIIIDSPGRHGWLFQGPHDSVFIGVGVIDASQETDNTWDAIHCAPFANGRFLSIHTWSRSVATKVQRYGLYLTAGGNDFANSHFEGSRTANVYIGSQLNQFSACLFYAAKGGLNIDVRAPHNIIYGMLSDPVAGTPACIGVRLGTSIGENVTNCDINLVSLGQEAGAVDVTNSNGNNKIVIRGFNNAGVPMVGTVKASDYIDLRITGNGGGTVQAEAVSDGITAAGSTQGTATLISLAQITRVSTTPPGSGVRLRAGQPGSQIIVYNAGANGLNIYPDTGAQIDKLGANAAFSLPADRGVILVCSTAAQWNTLRGM